MTVYSCRLEYLTPNGWWVGHSCINLVNPARYVERLAARGKFGRVILLDTGEIIEPENLPDLSSLVPSETAIPRLPTATVEGPCDACEDSHAPPYDGRCLL